MQGFSVEEASEGSSINLTPNPNFSLCIFRFQIQISFW